MRISLIIGFALLINWSNALVASLNMPFCAESTIEITIDQSTDLGFSGRDLLNLASGQKILDWTWDYKTDQTKLEMRVTSIETKAHYIDSVAVYPNGAPDIEIICPNRIEVPVWVTFTTEDGAFSERWYTTLVDTDGTDCMPETGDLCLSPGTEASFTYNFKREDLNGQFYSDVAVPEDLTVDFFAQGAFTHDSAKALVHGQAYSCSNEACYSYQIYGGHTPVHEPVENK